MDSDTKAPADDAPNPVKRARMCPAPDAVLPAPSTCYVVSTSTTACWPRIIPALAAERPGASILYDGVLEAGTGAADAVLASLRDATAASPLRYVVFVALWSESGEQYVRACHRITRAINPCHPYSDCMWGVLTAADEEGALRIAGETAPLEIRRVVSGSVEGCDLNAFQSGVAFNELVKGHGICKRTGDTRPSDVVVEGDSTLTIAAAIEHPGTDMIITSGHARESEWNVGFRFPAGQFRPSPEDGTLWAHTDAVGPDAVREGATSASATVSRREIKAAGKPKVYSAAGNCLMGHVNSERCMALAWMKSAGVRQMFGYTVPTWFGFAGWGVHRYLWGNVGQLTFAEAWFANQQALQLRLAQLQSKKQAGLETAAEKEDAATVSAAAAEAADGAADEANATSGGLTAAEAFELRGLVFDADSTVLYGHPAWHARMVPDALPGNGHAKDYYTMAMEQTTEGDRNKGRALFRVQVTTLRSGCWTPTCADDKDTLPGRPPFLLHDHPIRDVQAIMAVPGLGDASHATGTAPGGAAAAHGPLLVVTSLFAMVPLVGTFEAGEVITRQFSACVN